MEVKVEQDKVIVVVQVVATDVLELKPRDDTVEMLIDALDVRLID